MTETFWHPGDKAWMAQRKAAWRQVKQSLDVISSNYPLIKRKDHKHHKELFFFGTVNPGCATPCPLTGKTRDASCTGAEAFDYALPLFRLWYHPEPDQLDFTAVLSEYVRCATIRGLREKFFKNFFGAGVRSGRKMFSPATGMMNGREALCVRQLFPGLDYQTPAVVTGDPQIDNHSYQAASAFPSHVGQWAMHDTSLELMMDARFVPYAPGQYLWDHLSYNMEHYPEEMLKPQSSRLTTEDMRWRFMKLIAEILAFEQRTDASRNRPSTIALVESLIGKYERKEFSDAMLALWDETKQNFSALQKEGRWIVCYRDQEWLEEDGMPIEKQQERVSQWKQV